MTPEDRHEQARRLAERYRRASRKERTTILDALCATAGLNRKYVIGLLHEPPDKKRRRARKRGRPAKYGPEASDYPWSAGYGQGHTSTPHPLRTGSRTAK